MSLEARRSEVKGEKGNQISYKNVKYRKCCLFFLCFDDGNFHVKWLSKNMQLPELKSSIFEITEHVTFFTIGTAIGLKPYTDLSTIFRVPAHRQEAQVFSSKGIVKDIPLHLVVVPVSRQCLRERKEDHFYLYNKH